MNASDFLSLMRSANSGRTRFKCLQCLLLLRNRGGSFGSLAELSEAMGVNRVIDASQHWLGSLVKDRHVEIIANVKTKNDGRTIRLTAKGEKFMEEFSKKYCL